MRGVCATDYSEGSTVEPWITSERGELELTPEPGVSDHHIERKGGGLHR